MGQRAAQGEGDPLYLQWSSQGRWVREVSFDRRHQQKDVEILAQGQTVGERPALTPTVSPVPPHMAPSIQGPIPGRNILAILGIPASS